MTRLALAVLLLSGCTGPASRSAAHVIPAAMPSLAAGVDEPDLARPSRASVLPPLPSPAVIRESGGRGHHLRGVASWFATGPDGMYAAAGPVLRRFLSPRWRGKVVRICASTCIRVTLDDWCACPHRLIDLSDQAFRRLAPLSMGLVRVKVG